MASFACHYATSCPLGNSFCICFARRIIVMEVAAKKA
jgi:hypothetical protein